ncbi:hypothetical protein C8R42DRAFT_729797 [Lentinula raphanica]|nr:hypothetical protein C8R42DRAFT_729797 [Lentinula raphanica]
MAPERSSRTSHRRNQLQESPHHVSMCLRMRSMKEPQDLGATLAFDSAAGASDPAPTTKEQGPIFSNSIDRDLLHEPLASDFTTNTLDPNPTNTKGKGRSFDVATTSMSLASDSTASTLDPTPTNTKGRGCTFDVTTTSTPTTSNAVFSDGASMSTPTLSKSTPDASFSAPGTSIPIVNASIPTVDASIPTADASIPTADASIPSTDASTPNSVLSALILPPKPLVPKGIPANDPLIERMERKSSKSQRLYDEQQATIKFIEEYIETLKQLCEDNEEILRLKQFMDKLEHTCLSCHELAWNPHMYVLAALMSLSNASPTPDASTSKRVTFVAAPHAGSLSVANRSRLSPLALLFKDLP